MGPEDPIIDDDGTLRIDKAYLGCPIISAWLTHMGSQMLMQVTLILSICSLCIWQIWPEFINEYLWYD